MDKLRTLLITYQLRLYSYCTDTTDTVWDTVVISEPDLITGVDSLVAVIVPFGTEMYMVVERVDTLQTVQGCDSVVTLNLTINNTSFINDSMVSCDSVTGMEIGITPVVYT